MNIQDMLIARPRGKEDVARPLIACLEECELCAQVCDACVDACLGESDVSDLGGCIRLDLDCADLCRTTAAIVRRRTGHNETVLRILLEACAVACLLCAKECDRHATMHRHCRLCAEQCRRCEQACRDLLEKRFPPQAA